MIADLAHKTARSSLVGMAGRGRPRRDPSAGPPSFHLGLRFDTKRGDLMLKLVELANERAVEHGIPATVTPSSLAYLWISERLEVEAAKLDGKKRR